MDDPEVGTLLAEIHRLMAPHQDVVGQLEVTGQGIVSLLKGRQLLVSAEIHRDESMHPSIAHAHVIVESSDAVFGGHLDACIMGINPDREMALKEAARNWFDAVAGPIFSLFHAKPVLGAEHFEGTERWGVAGAHGFVGPLVVRFGNDDAVNQHLLESNLFEFAAEMAPPGQIHLAKTTLNKRQGQWQRTIAVDGHAASYAESAWQAGCVGPTEIVASRFATFHFGGHADTSNARESLDALIEDYVRVFERTRDLDATYDELAGTHHPLESLDRVRHFILLALGRALITEGLPVETTKCYHRVLASGELIENVPLMSEPAYARSMMLVGKLMSGPHFEAVKQLAICSAEVNVINDALKGGSKLEDLRLSPFIVPDLGVSAEAFSLAMRSLAVPSRPKSDTTSQHAKKPWWKFW